MPGEKINHALENLHRELQKSKTDDAAKQEAIDRLREDVTQVLGSREKDAALLHSKLNSNLKESLILFEASHPELFEAIEGVLTIFGNMGL